MNKKNTIFNQTVNLNLKLVWFLLNVVFLFLYVEYYQPTVFSVEIVLKTLCKMTGEKNIMVIICILFFVTFSLQDMGGSMLNMIHDQLK